MEMDDIVGHFVPELRKKFKGKILGVYLFGSIDKGTATPESDIDILVVYSDNMVF
jgi:predicted nucleotidyltransferase